MIFSGLRKKARARKAGYARFKKLGGRSSYHQFKKMLRGRVPEN